MSLHILTFGIRLKNTTACALFTELVRKKLPVSLQSKDIVDNIANKSSFSLRMLGSPKVIEIKCEKTGKKTYKHEQVKRALYPENKSVFDFILRPPNNEAPVIYSPILDNMSLKSVKSSNQVKGLDIVPKDQDNIPLWSFSSFRFYIGIA